MNRDEHDERGAPPSLRQEATAGRQAAALQRFVERAVRGLPDRRAPRSLEARVLAAIADRITLRWWQRSYAAWPLAARAAFLFVSLAIGLVALLPLAVDFGSAPLLVGAAEKLGAIRDTLSSISGAGGAVARAIGRNWILGAAAGVFALYFTLFGIGAAAYRLQARAVHE